MNELSREATWERIGTDVSSAKSLQEVLQLSDLDYEVVKKPVYVDIDGDKILYPNRVATVNAKTGQTLGIVSPRYEICQNELAFDFVNSITEDVEFVKAGMTHTGMVYIIAKMNTTNVLGDAFTPYIIFQNSHNGEYTLKSTITPLRIVCQNQFNVSFNNSSNNIAIRHSSLLDSKMNEGRLLLENAAEYITNFNASAEEIAAIKVDYKKKKRLLDKMFTVTPDMAKRAIENVEMKKERFLAAYESDDNQNFKGTAWGFLNAYSDYITHLPIQDNRQFAENNRFMNVSVLSNQMNNMVKMLAGSALA